MASAAHQVARTGRGGGGELPGEGFVHADGIDGDWIADFGPCGGFDAAFEGSAADVVIGVTDVERGGDLTRNDVCNVGLDVDFADSGDEIGSGEGDFFDTGDPAGGGGESVVTESHGCRTGVVGEAGEL